MATASEVDAREVRVDAQLSHNSLFLYILTLKCRIHWAQERTFLSWMRLCANAIAFGLMLVRLGEGEN
jgi:uncharacterized membrane protein YidH (DUF202 family)